MIGFTTKVQILKPAVVTDRYGNEVLDYENGTPVDVERLVSVQPTTQTEDTDARLMVVNGWRLITPAGVDIPLAEVDRVLFNGREVEVAGNVLRWPHPVVPGKVHHVEADLTLVRG